MATIIIDARKYFDFGIGEYIQHLVEGLAKLRSKHSFCLLVAPGDEKKVAGPEGWRVEPIAYGKYSVGEFFLMGRKINALGEKILFHAPHYTLPLGVKRSVVTIHDVIPLRLPQYFSIVKRLYASFMVRHAIREARFILPISKTTRNDILDLFGAPKEKIIVIPLGISPRFGPLPEKEKKSFRMKHGLVRPYVLFVGNPKPHKGIPTLILAFERIANLFPNLDLALTGGGSNADLGPARIPGERIKMLGRIADADLVAAYNCAEMLVMPSLYEGFGLPPLEAMACGTPVIASEAGSLPEVVGDAAMLFQTGNPRALADAMTLLLGDHQLRSRMIARGKKRARQFSWKETARRTLEVYETVLAETE